MPESNGRQTIVFTRSVCLSACLAASMLQCRQYFIFRIHVPHSKYIKIDDLVTLIVTFMLIFFRNVLSSEHGVL